MFSKRLSLFLVFLLSALVGVHAQVQTGTPSFASLDTNGPEAINLGNLNAFWNVPILSKTGRGLPLNYSLAYNSLVWYPIASGSTQSWQPVTANGTYWGWQGLSTAGQSEVVYNMSYGTGSCYTSNEPSTYQTWGYNAVSYIDPKGTVHALQGPGITAIQSVGGQCPTGVHPSSQVSLTTNDGSGITGVMNGGVNGYVSINLTDKHGTAITAPLVQFNSQNQAQGTLAEQDSNGNQINVNNGQYTDTTGKVALTITGTAPNNTVLAYPLPPGGANSTASYTVSYKSYTVATSFGCSGIGEYGPTSVPLVDKITRPDGNFYQFIYEPTPGNGNDVTGRIASVTLPAGGTVSYSYSGGCNGSGGINADGSVGSLTRTTSDGKRTYTRASINGNASSTTRTDEKGNQTYYAFTIASNDFYETHRQVYQGSNSGTPLEERFTCYNGSSENCDGNSISEPVSEADVTDSFNGGSQTLTKNAYTDSGTLLSQSTLYNGSTQLTQTKNAYTITSNNLVELTSTTQYDPSNNAYTYSYFNYDETTPTATSGLPQHTSGGSSRGNLTSAHTSAGATYLTTTTAYYDTGMPVSTTAADGGVTQYSYDGTGTFVTGTTLPTPSSGVSMSTSASYDTASGALLSSKGVNGETTTFNVYDSLLRPTTATLPPGGQVAWTYSPTQNTTTWNIGNNTANGYVLNQMDGYGRSVRQANFNGQSGNPYYQQDTCLDATGLPSFVPVTYQGSGFGSTKQCSGNGASYVYDALGRVTSIKTPDGTATIQYQSRAVMTTDVNGVQRITQYDLMGRVAGVCEISNSTLSGAAPSSCTYNLNGTNVAMDIGGTGFVTGYSYNLVSHITTVTQGAQTRAFQTDPAGRTISITEPERGPKIPTTYTYSYNSTGLQVVRARPQANQTSTGTLTHTTTQYDTLGRVVSIGYDDNLTPNKNFYYDQPVSSLGWSQAPTNPKGYLVATSAGSGASLTRSQFSYDTLGDITVAWQCTPSICGGSNQASRPAEQAGYDLVGHLIASNDGAAGQINYGRSPAGELISMTQNSYTNSANTPNLVSNVVNGPFGPINWTLGNGLQGVKSYDSSGRYSGIWICQGQNTSSTMYCPSGDNQLYGSTSNFSGSRSTGVCDTAMNQCQGMGYDEFNRLNVVSNNNSKYTYSYDIYGNRLTQTSSPSGPAPNHTYDPTTNRINDGSVSYDAAGNLMGDGISHSFTYDAEGNVVSVDNGSTASYVYDALNRRVSSKTSAGTTEYTYNAQGQRTSSWLVDGSATGAGNEGRIYWDGQQFAYRSWDGSTYFQHKSVLGTDRLRTNYQGQVATTETSLAFGDGFSQSNSSSKGATQENDQYAGLEHDAESSSEHATFRQYSSTQGRWMSPDPYNGSYDPTNPQSFNRYSYVLNNPFFYTDPAGLEDVSCEDEDGSCESGSGGGGDFWNVTGGIYSSGVGEASGSDGGIASAGTVTPCGMVFCLTVTSQLQNNTGDSISSWFLQTLLSSFYGNASIQYVAGPGSLAPNLVPQNPCQYAGRALPPSAYGMAGQYSKGSPVNFGLDVAKGFPRSGYLDAQPLTGAPTLQAAAYGNYAYGVYMQAFGLSLSQALSGANAYAFFSGAKYGPSNGPLDSQYGSIPAANVANITNGFNAQQNGTTCHK